jgi:hypothetical protein
VLGLDPQGADAVGQVAGDVFQQAQGVVVEGGGFRRINMVLRRLKWI